MVKDLSEQSEQYLANMVAGGLFPSKEAALEAAVAALREKTEQIALVPDEHMARVEQALESADAGLTSPMTTEYWDGLRQNVRDIAAGNSPNS